MRQLRWVGLSMVLAAAGCGSEPIAALIKGIAQGQAPRQASQKIADGFKSFWKSVQSAPTKATEALKSVPTRGQAAVKKVRQALTDYLASAQKIIKPADSGNDCALVGLESDGDGYCYDEDGRSLVVFCSGGEPYALDCGTLAERAFCAVNGDSIDCVTAPDSQADPAVIGDGEEAADSSVPCDPAAEGAAECEGNYLVFCSGGEVRELDCSTFADDGGNTASCGTLSSEVTCGWNK